jgi:hypothetical protein
MSALVTHVVASTALSRKGRTLTINFWILARMLQYLYTHTHRHTHIVFIFIIVITTIITVAQRGGERPDPVFQTSGESGNLAPRADVSVVF